MICYQILDRSKGNNITSTLFCYVLHLHYIFFKAYLIPWGSGRGRIAEVQCTVTLPATATALPPDATTCQLFVTHILSAVERRRDAQLLLSRTRSALPAIIPPFQPATLPLCLICGRVPPSAPLCLYPGNISIGKYLG